MTVDVVALLAALALGAAAVVQHDAASTAPAPDGTHRGGGLRLLGSLALRPRWLLGQATGALGLVLLAAALHRGQVALVQPLLAVQLVFSLLVAGLVQRHRTGSTGWGRGHLTGALLVLTGLLAFLVGAHPSSGVPAPHGPALAAATAGALGLAAGASAGARHLPVRARAATWAAAAGAGFGVDALLMKATTGAWAAGHLLTWPALALVVVSTVSVVLSQRAFQAGAITAVLPLITVLEPVLAVLLAGSVFAEHLSAQPLMRAAQLLGAGTLAAGVLVLARAGRPSAPHAPSDRHGAASDDRTRVPAGVAPARRSGGPQATSNTLRPAGTSTRPQEDPHEHPHQHRYR